MINPEQSLSLLKDLIAIPSFVDPGHNENGVVHYLSQWSSENLPNFQQEVQPLPGGRKNLILKKGNPGTIFLAHTDTVAPSQDATYPQLKATEVNGFLYGRGSTDMKSGVASMLTALSNSPDTNNLWYCLYADEEYDFLGMKGLVDKFTNEKIKPKLIVSSDGSDLQLSNGCRGLLELRGRFTGKTGHPAKGNGNPAIEKGMQVLLSLKESLSDYTHPVMGATSYNIAHFIGGARQPDSLDSSGNVSKVGQAGNVIPDIAEFVIDIRPASPDLTLPKVIQLTESRSKETDVNFEVIKKTHALGAWFTPLEEVQPFLEIATKINPTSPVADPKVNGYIDLQMLWDVAGRPPAVLYGGGEGNTAHTPEERINIDSYFKETEFFQQALKQTN